MDQPTADGLNTFFVAKAAHASGLKAALSGLGADEIFRGYRHYHWLAKYGCLVDTFGRLPQSARRTLAEMAASAGVWAGSESWERLRGLGEATHESLYLAMRGFFSPVVVGRLTGRSADEVLRRVPRFDDSAADSSGFADATAFQMAEIKRYLHDQLLRDADVFGMAWSLEIRVPYLDHEVAERALAAGDSSHMRSGINKPMLVDTIHDDGVLEAARRPKRGFTFPLEKWMRRHSAELRELALRADLDRSEIKRLWLAFEGGHMNAVRAWALVVMGAMRDGECD
jgi:asparagine synthase (glutamine-hydrolysing)